MPLRLRQVGVGVHSLSIPIERRTPPPNFGPSALLCLEISVRQCADCHPVKGCLRTTPPRDALTAPSRAASLAPPRSPARSHRRQFVYTNGKPTPTRCAGTIKPRMPWGPVVGARVGGLALSPARCRLGEQCESAAHSASPACGARYRRCTCGLNGDNVGGVVTPPPCRRRSSGCAGPSLRSPSYNDLELVHHSAWRLR